MIAAICPAPPNGAAFVRRMVDFVDCQAQTIGAGGYQALAAPGSTLSLVLTGFLTLFVAFFGYRLLFGQAPSVRDGVLALVKIGIVLALATGWTAYRTLIYDVALRGPAELAADIGRPAGLPGAGGGLVGRLAFADSAFEALAVAQAPPTPQVANPPGSTPEILPGFNSFALGGARIVFLTAAIGALALVRLVAGLLLALGPFFIAFLLFESTRGLFEGWVRVLAGAALGAVGTAIVLGVQLALLEPWLVDLLTRRYAGQPIPGAPVELFVATLLFALVLLGILYAAARVAMGFRFPDGWRSAQTQFVETVRDERLRLAAMRETGAAPAEGRSRAVAVADAVSATQRREAAPGPAGLSAAPAGAPSGVTRVHAPSRDLPAAAPTPLGRSFRRRTTSRVSARADRRDLA